EINENNITVLNNLVIFGLDINSGAIIVPENATLSNNQVIARVRNNSEFIFFNSSNQLVITSGNTVNDVNSSTKIMSFDENTGFSNIKGSDQSSNTFTYTAMTGVPNSMLVGFLPSKQVGINYTFWLSALTRGIGDLTFSYQTGVSSPAITISMTSGNNLRKSFDYYVVPVNDDFVNIGTEFGTVNKNGADISSGTADRGYVNNSSASPVFKNVYKRFFYTGFTENTSNNTLSENFGVLLDSYYSMFASFASFPSLVNTANKSVSLKTLESKVYNMNNKNSSSLRTPTVEDLKNLPSDVSINIWEYDTVGYDKESNFVYFSLSGQEANITDGNFTELDKYYTNTRYINLKEENVSKNVSVDAYVEDSPYTLSDVSFDTYIDTKNLYLVKQVIDGNSGQWMSTSVEEFDDDSKDFTPTKDPNISFSSLETLAKDLENSSTLDEVMPSAMNTNLNSFDSFLSDKGWINNVSFKSATGNDETGEISLETQITYPNDFGNEETNQNGNVSYVSYVRLIGFSVKDFSLTFKQNTDSAVTDIKAKYSAEKIVETNNKAFVINHMLQNFTVRGKNYIPEADTVTLKNGTTTSDLIVEIKVPIKTSPTDEKGILPVGFPESDAIVTMNYNGFTGTDTPPIEQYPITPSNPDNSNPIQQLSTGSIAGIVIGSFALAAIIITTIIIIMVRVKITAAFNKK
ncbi:MAG: hypothetical protein K2J02_01385, partial [Malacoplasma sp.]|nr:hypothetical protein [Malacoplasma sp.]